MNYQKMRQRVRVKKPSKLKNGTPRTKKGLKDWGKRRKSRSRTKRDRGSEGPLRVWMICARSKQNRLHSVNWTYPSILLFRAVISLGSSNNLPRLHRSRFLISQIATYSAFQTLVPKWALFRISFKVLSPKNTSNLKSLYKSLRGLRKWKR